MLNTIESVSMQMLIDSETDPVLKKVLGSLDLALSVRRRLFRRQGLVICSGLRRRRRMISTSNFSNGLNGQEECFSAIGHGGKVRSREKGAVRGFPKAHFCRGICGGKMCGRS